MMRLMAGYASPALSPLVPSTGELPQVCVADCFTQMSIAGVSGEKFPKRTHALS